METEQNSILPVTGNNYETVGGKENCQPLNETRESADGKKSEPSYGKFSSLEELVKAYTSLESEFTRRSQKLKEYEKAVLESVKEKKENEGEEDLARKYSVDPHIVEEAVALAKTREDERKVKDALISVLARKVLSTEEMANNPKVVDRVLSKDENREAVINAYIEKIKMIDAPTTLPRGGSIPAVPTMKTDSLKDAGEIAKAILQKLSY